MVRNGMSLSGWSTPGLGRRLLLHLLDTSYWALGLWCVCILRSETYERCVRSYYRAASRSYDRRALFDGYGAPLEAALALLRPMCSPSLVLDAACGTGWATLTVGAAFPRARVVGVDLTPSMLDLARARAKEGGLTDVEFLQGNIGRLPFDAASFDLVILQNAPVALTELVRVVRPTGTILIAFSLGAEIPGVLLRLFLRAVRRRAAIVACGHEGRGFWMTLAPPSCLSCCPADASPVSGEL